MGGGIGTTGRCAYCAWAPICCMPAAGIPCWTCAPVRGCCCCWPGGCCPPGADIARDCAVQCTQRCEGDEVVREERVRSCEHLTFSRQYRKIDGVLPPPAHAYDLREVRTPEVRTARRWRVAFAISPLLQVQLHGLGSHAGLKDRLPKLKCFCLYWHARLSATWLEASVVLGFSPAPCRVIEAVAIERKRGAFIKHYGRCVDMQLSFALAEHRGNIPREHAVPLPSPFSQPTG